MKDAIMEPKITGPNSVEYWQMIFDQVPFPIYIADMDSFEVIVANAAMRRRDPVMAGQPCYRVIYRQEAPCSYCRSGELKGKARLPVEESVCFEAFSAADQRWYRVHEHLLAWIDGRLVKHSTAVDISELKQCQSDLTDANALLTEHRGELERVSATDRLTGLYHRDKLDALFLQEHERAGRYGHALSVIVADIDKFKAVNDLFGHHVGDTVLSSVAETLARAMRKTDILGRWGGEEFMIICPSTDLDGARISAEHLRRLVKAIDLPKVGCKTASFGVAQLVPGETLDALVARAEKALFRAKEKGRNRVEILTP